MRRFARIPNSGSPWKCAFCLTRDGKALKVQRTIFSECFYVMAMDELARVTGDKDMQVKQPRALNTSTIKFSVVKLAICDQYSHVLIHY